MSEICQPKLAKWPFFTSDLLLLFLAGWVAWRSGGPVGLWPMWVCFAAVALGAWLCIIPFLREYDARLKLAEAETLTTTVAQLQNLESIRSQIAEATSRWHVIQDAAAKATQSAREISDRIAAQTQEFSTFFQRALDQEKNTLRLEVEKLKRGEGEWLQAVVRILDNVHVLHHAGLRSGQPELIDELTRFQNACRDAARRIGLIPFCPAQNESFDPRVHQLPDGHAAADSGAAIAELLAPGFTFQTQLLRRALVKLAARNGDLKPEPGSTPMDATAHGT